VLLALTVSVALLGAACGNGADLEVLATVDGVEITIDELLELYSNEDAENRPGLEALADFDTAGALSLGGPGITTSLGSLILLESIRDEALALGIETPVLDSQRAIDEDIPILVDQLRIAVPSEAELDEVTSGFIESRPCSRHILVDTEDEGAAALARLDAGEDFAALAAEVSTDPGSATQGGDLGCNDLTRFDPAFAAGLSGLEVGDRSGVVESSFGFHIIERTPAPDELVAQAERDARTQIVQQWFNDRALEAVVELDPAVGVWSGTGINAADPGANS